MKATVNPISLLKELKKMSVVVRENNIIPITGCVLFSFKKKQLTLMGTDLETTYISQIDCESKDEFSFPINYPVITEICQTSNSPITIELTDSNILITGKAKYKLSLYGKADEFPTVPVDEFNVKMEVDADFFEHLIKANTVRNKEDLKVSLNMACINIGKKETDVVGCDGFSLYKKTFKVNNKDEVSVMVCDKFVNMCKSFGAATLEIGTSFIKATCLNETIISRLSENKYVNYKQVIPNDINYNLEIPTGDFKESISSISVASNKTSRIMAITFKDGKIKLRSEDIDYGKEAETEMPLTHSVEIETIGLNLLMLSHLLTLSNSEDIEMSFTGESKSICLKPKDDDSVLMLLQPLTLN